MRTAGVGPQFPLVLNVSSGHHGVSPEMAESIGAAVRSAAMTGKTDWLAQGKAFDIAFAGDPDAVRAALRGLNDEWLLDVNIVPARNRRKKLLVADMDSTI